MSKIIVKKAEHYGITREHNVEEVVSKIMGDEKTNERCEGLTNRGVRVEKDEFGRMTFILRFSSPVADMKVLLKRHPLAAYDLGYGKAWDAAPKKPEIENKSLDLGTPEPEMAKDDPDPIIEGAEGTDNEEI